MSTSALNDENLVANSDATDAPAGSTAVGIDGPLRNCTPGAKGRRKLSAGDIAVIDAPNLDRREAQWLLDARPGAVVNAAPFSTGTIPNYGPLMLSEAGIPLFENGGAELIAGFRDGARKGRVEADGRVLVGNKEVGQTDPLSHAEVEEAYDEAQRTLIDTVGAFAGNSIEFVATESPLLVEGLGIPDVGEELRGRKVLIMTPHVDNEEKLRQLRNFIREYDPVLIAVENAADTLVKNGYSPAFIVGDPTLVGNDALRSGSKVILPADPDGHATGLERIQDLGVGAMTFPAATDSATDLALMLADYHGAELIVHTGQPLSLRDIFERSPEATPSALLTRATLGPVLVDGDAIISLYSTNSSSATTWLWAILGLLVAVAAVFIVIGVAGDASFTENLQITFSNLLDTIRRWFN